MSRRRTLGIGRILAAALAASLAAVKVNSASGHKAAPTYLVTVTNLTDCQPLTPPVVALHRRGAYLIQIGRPATHELQQITENGNVAPKSDPGGAGFASQQAFILSGGGVARYLSLISMLICTNDGFAGVDSVKLSRHVWSDRDVLLGRL